MTDVNAVIDEIGMGSFQFLLLAIQAGVRMTDLAEITTSSSILPGLQLQWEISSYEKACLMTVNFLGIFIGSMISGIWADRCGRRSGILGSLAGLGIFGTCVACCWGPYSMLAARFCLGCCFGFGISPVLSMCVEISPINWRGSMINFSELSAAAGVCAGAFLLWIFMPDFDTEHTYKGIAAWRIVTLAAISPSFLAFPFAWRYLYESPIFLAVDGKNKQALEVLDVMASMNGAEHAVQDLRPIDIAINFKPSEKSRLLPNEHLEEKADYWENLSTLVYDHTALLFGSMWLCFLGNFLYFGQSYALPQLFRGLHGNTLHPAFEVLMMALAQVFGSLLSMALSRSNLVGQRDCLSTTAVLMGILLFFVSSLEKAPPQPWGFRLMLATVYSVNCLTVVFFTQSYIFISEAFPSSCRCTAVATCTAVGRFAPMFAPVLFEISGKSSGNGTQSSFWALQSALSFATVFIIRACLTYEMKGQPLQHETCTLPIPTTNSKTALQGESSDSEKRVSIVVQL